MINEQNSNQTNPQTSTNMSYGYPTNLMNLSSMQNSNDLYSYYPNNLYQPFGTFDEYNQWTSSRENSTIVSSSNTLLHSPQYYPTSNPSQDLFDYSTYPSTNDFSWNIPNYNYQSSIPVIGNQQKKSTIGDRCDNLLAQQMNSIHLNNSNDLSIIRPSNSKSYASVVSSETNKKSNVPMRIMSNEFNSSQQTSTIKKIDQQYNPKDFNLNPKGARFFVIKSYSEDDVHRSIKYNIWCSTEHGNKRLDRAIREREGKGPIYLFFSVNASGHFCGIAEMITPVDYEHQTDIWHMSNKWQGKFEVKWIYVKDVPNQQFRNIRLENNENKPVTNSRDTQEIPYEEGKLMLKIFHMYRHKTSIFDDFQYYESKQAEEISTKK